MCERLICQPCVEREIRGWKMQPDGAWWTLIYHSFKDLVEQEEKLMPDVFGSPRQGGSNGRRTPGPWKFTRDEIGKRTGTISKEDGSEVITNVEYWIKDANAHFIAAAPDMEEALDGLLRMCFEDLSGEESGAIIEVALAALAKARGE